ncbi:tetratricopeptide repeat protein [uncultured Tyzzerella sp.]|uniref:tetratricopeptide repeat protein n=1 Tax=uncultured Tyzzerella sp. TaxID=2321398 RepID=UPI002941E471|nr:tetratricopeptide repeat protein [uncultured Tyzzerella sp.]
MVSSLKLSMAEDIIIPPYRLTNGISIYSVEEAIYLFYKNFKEYSTDFFEDKFINWVYNDLLNVEVANKLMDIKKQKSFYQKSIEFLTLNNFYSSEEIENISLELFNWEKRGQVERKKIKGDRFFKENMFEKAIESYKDAIDFDISNAILYNNVGICYIRLKNYDLALRYLQKAINIDTDNKDILFNIIELLIEKEDFEYAKEFIDSLNDNMLYSKYYYLGEIYFKQKEYTKAKVSYTKAYLFEKSNNIILKLATCYINLNLYDKAIKCLNIIEDSDIDILIAKSEIYEKINNIPMAIKCIERANFYNRDNYILWLKLARYYRQDYNILKAEGAIYKAYTLAPDNEEVLFEQSLIKKAQGKFKEYRSILSKILQKSSKNYKESLYNSNKQL